MAIAEKLNKSLKKGDDQKTYTDKFIIKKISNGKIVHIILNGRSGYHTVLCEQAAHKIIKEDTIETYDIIKLISPGTGDSINVMYTIFIQHKITKNT